MTEAQAFEILGINASKTYRQRYNRYRYLAKKHHPDKGGNAETFRVIQSAWERVKDSIPKRPLVVLLVNGSLYERWIHDGTIHGDWMEYQKRDNTYYLMDSNHTTLYDIPKEDKVLQDGVNCKVCLVGKQKWIHEYCGKNLWIVPRRKC